MRAILIAAACLLIASPALSQTPSDTFCAGSGTYVAPFQINDGYDSCRVAILLPDGLVGHWITGIRARFEAPSTGGPVPESTWMADAAFAWGIASGSAEEPGANALYLVNVSLKQIPDLRIGGSFESQVNWELPPGTHYWLIGYWQRNAKFVRLSQNQYQESMIAISATAVPWQLWSGGGLQVEVMHSADPQEIPAGVFDLPSGGPEKPVRRLQASLSASELVVSLSDPTQPYRLTVVNVLGQTIVNEAGTALAGEIRLPWSASRPSGVYFCRVVQGQAVYTIPVVNLK